MKAIPRGEWFIITGLFLSEDAHVVEVFEQSTFILKDNDIVYVVGRHGCRMRSFPKDQLGLTNSSLTMSPFLSWVGEDVVPVLPGFNPPQTIGHKAEIEASNSNENRALVTSSQVNSFILFFMLLIDAFFILLYFLSIMKFISWNVRGSNKPGCIYDISKLLIKYSPYIFFIIESKTPVDYWPAFSKKWGRQYNLELVPTNGRSSGLLRGWKPSLSFHIEGKTKHFIWGKLLDPSIKASYHVCGAYGSPKREKKIEFMTNIYSLISQDEL